MYPQGAYNVNITKLGATLITCTRSNQWLISNGKAKEPRAVGSRGVKLCIARATSVHVPRARPKKCVSSRDTARQMSWKMRRRQELCRRGAARDASRSRRVVGSLTWAYSSRRAEADGADWSSARSQSWVSRRADSMDTARASCACIDEGEVGMESARDEWRAALLRVRGVLWRQQRVFSWDSLSRGRAMQGAR